MDKAIKVENLSKAYQIGEFSTGTLSRDIERWWALSRGKEDPFLKIGETNVRSSKGSSNVVWSLKDLNFEVEQGEAIGIIGKNGAGKSTLLKVLSQVTTPTTGTVKMKGRVASLLEVGTGFHPELTGRENIYLNGAILGMQKAEVKKKFDEIVDFSGVERYIDTPVKRYSSGMYVRLAFAVAAHLDSEILIVDEVLAVGDAEFQKKCIGKMGDISKGEGRTILFVSHVMQSVRSLCKKSILLEDGRIAIISDTETVLDEYLNKKQLLGQSNLNAHRVSSQGNIRVKNIQFPTKKNTFKYNSEISIIVDINSTSNQIVNNLYAYFKILDHNEQIVMASCNQKPFQIDSGEKKTFIISLIQNKNLMPGRYKVMLAIVEGHILNDNYYYYDIINGYPSFEIIPDLSGNGYKYVHRWKQDWGSILEVNTVEEISK